MSTLLVSWCSGRTTDSHKSDALEQQENPLAAPEPDVPQDVEATERYRDGPLSLTPHPALHPLHNEDKDSALPGDADAELAVCVFDVEVHGLAAGTYEQPFVRAPRRVTVTGWARERTWPPCDPSPPRWPVDPRQPLVHVHFSSLFSIPL